MRRPLHLWTRRLSQASLMLLASVAIGTAGCVGVVANIAHIVGADRVPAEYEGLKSSRVAVVTITDSSQYADDQSARRLSRYVSDILSKEVKDIRLVREDEIEKWRDENGWDNLDVLEIGQGVGAEKVLSIELDNLRLRDGATLYRGRADIRIEVIDVATEAVDYTASIDEFTFPKTAGQHTSETTESKFGKLYLGMLANKIARSFHPYDHRADFALDGTIASQ